MFAQTCHFPFSTNIQFTLILLLLLILGIDIHQNPVPEEYEFSVFHLNARSVRNKLSYLEDIASESSIICVTESHLDGNILDTDIGIDGFSDKIFRKDRNSFGGGVLVYTSQGICVKERHDLNCDGVEMLWIEVLIPNFKLLVCVVKSSSLNSEYGFLVNISMKTFINCGCLKALFMNTLYNSKDRISS